MTFSDGSLSEIGTVRAFVSTQAALYCGVFLGLVLLPIDRVRKLKVWGGYGQYCIDGVAF